MKCFILAATYNKKGELIKRLLNIIETECLPADEVVETEKYTIKYFFFPTLPEAEAKKEELKNNA